MNVAICLIQHMKTFGGWSRQPCCCINISMCAVKLTGGIHAKRRMIRRLVCTTIVVKKQPQHREPVDAEGQVSFPCDILEVKFPP